MTVRTPPSGEQFEIGYGAQRATIVEVGGGIREYSRAGSDVLDPYPLDAICDGAHGTPLIPWPNRLADGRYSFGGADHQLALTEPERHNAIHGLLRWRSWRMLLHEAASVVVGCRLQPMPGYPFCLEMQISYSLAEHGLTVATTAVNRGDTPCPYGAGAHPYLSAGAGSLDDCSLEIPAATRIVTDGERQLPIGREPVAGTSFDFRVARPLGGQRLDDAFTDLYRTEDGRATATLVRADGHRVELWVDEHHPLLEIYTGDTLDPARRRRGLGVEPMTCPPNAFQSGENLIELEPGGEITTRWGVRLVE